MTSPDTGKGVLVAPLTTALGLSGGELDLLETLFAGFTAASGINGKAIFARLRDGQSIGEALDLPKGTNELLYHRAHKWFSAGRVDKAEPLFRTLCILAGDDANFWIGYAACLRHRGELAGAEVAIETALTLRPDWPVARFHALELFAQLGNWPRTATELGSLDALPCDDLPILMLQEIERYRLVLDIRGFKAARRGTA